MATNGELDFEKGSSPQVRGTWQAIRYLFRATGIIPAGAGHFVYVANVHGCPWDHPRRCGALAGVRTVTDTLEGSSPQVRGTSPFLHTNRRDLGIIPAGAGHFLFRAAIASSATDHPRRCGALQGRENHWGAEMGSSPQVRGTSWEKLLIEGLLGIIPAGAGHFLW